MATKSKTVNKKSPKTTPEQEAAELAADLEVFEQQQHTGIVMAQAIARQVFGEGADRDIKLVLRIQELLLWEENGDPAEDQADITNRLQYAHSKAQEWFSGGVVTPGDVLDLHEIIHEDFFSEDEDE
jgi:hypothetical protein